MSSLNAIININNNYMFETFVGFEFILVEKQRVLGIFNSCCDEDVMKTLFFALIIQLIKLYETSLKS